MSMPMDHGAPRETDTVIVGNGPAALITSYILHGHIPYYDESNPHPDSILHDKLLQSGTDLLGDDINFLTEHFSASRFSYSTQALPVNVLLDTLVRPLGETEDGQKKTCVAWRFEPSRAISHLVIGQTDKAGGQWVDNPVQASWDIGTLSYAGMLSLPGYSLEDYYQDQYGRPMPIFLRPSRRTVAGYLAAYPDQVGISDSICNQQRVSDISRKGDGFFSHSHNLQCKHLILASGVFSELIAPRPLLGPLVNLADDQPGLPAEPLLVIGSGFSAADVIISSPPGRRILHIYKWAPTTSPSPLRGCHQHAYPEYAGVYRRMKLAALSSSRTRDKAGKGRRTTSDFESSRDWQLTYEGLPNTEIMAVELAADGHTATITLRSIGKNEATFQRRVGDMAYVVGRRGSLNYLSSELLKEILPASIDGLSVQSGTMISGQTLREKANEDLEVAPHVFVVGSLTGDSLIRFAYGGCAYAAGKIMRRSSTQVSVADNHAKSNGVVKARLTQFQTPSSSPRIPAMCGLDGHEASPVSLAQSEDRPLDRRKDS